MAMSKKDFIALADTLRAVRASYSPHWDANLFRACDDHVKALADFCAGQNPNFNRERWLDYIAGKCGPSGGSIKGSAHAQTWTKKCGRCNGETEAGPDTQHYTCFFCGNEGRV